MRTVRFRRDRAIRVVRSIDLELFRRNSCTHGSFYSLSIEFIENQIPCILIIQSSRQQFEHRMGIGANIYLTVDVPCLHLLS